jgi:hypothetical protein
MHPHRTRDTVLTLIGFAAWLIYVLACASFSPDDSKILFPSVDPRTGSLALAMYDRHTGSTQQLLTLQSKDTLYMRAAWMPDGRRALALWSVETGSGFSSSMDDIVNIAVLPVTMKEPPRVMTVRLPEMDMNSYLLQPPPIVGSSLLLAGKKYLARVDLETGEVTSKEGGEAILVAQGEHVYYLRGLPDTVEAKPPRFEIGRVDTKALTWLPLFQSDEKPDEELRGDFAVSGDGSKFAVAGKTKDLFQVHVFEGTRLSKTIPAGARDEKLELGSLVFSRDGVTIYAPFIRKLADDGPAQFGILELPVGGGTARQTPLFTVATGSEDLDATLFQVDLSHDGKTLAASSTYLQSGKEPRLRPEDVALYLVDLSRPDRKVTKIPVLAPPAARTATEKK